MPQSLIGVSPNLVQEILEFLNPFNTIFDHLEMSTKLHTKCYSNIISDS